MSHKKTSKRPAGAAQKTVTKAAEPVKVAKSPRSRFRLPKRGPKPVRPATMRKLPPAWRLFIQACKVPSRHWEIFGGIMLAYAAINVVLIGGLGGGDDLVVLKESLNDAFTGQFSKISSGLALFGVLATNSANSVATGVAGAYSTMLLLVITLALVWALRQVYAGNDIRVRDAFYKGMQPLIPFLFVFLVIGLQTVPAGLGGFFYSMFVGGGIFQTPLEVALASILLFLLLAASVYMLCASLFALYIITLPDMTPLSALRSARQIVRFRRGAVLLKLFFLPVALALGAAVFMVPVSLLLTQFAPFMFFLVTMVGLVIIHSYMYALYRELIAE